MSIDKIKILHLEDSSFDATLIHRELKKGGIDFEVLVVETRKDFISALTQFQPNIILSDHSLPSFDSLAALQILKEQQVKIPFVLITATTSEENVVTIMKEGAWDYILKDRLQRLPSAVMQAVEKHNSQQAKNAAELELAVAHRKVLFHIENSPLGFVEWDNEFRIKSWSKRAEDIFGWSEFEILQHEQEGKPFHYASNEPWIREIANELIATNLDRTQIVSHNSTRDGRMVWCEWHISIQKDLSGNITTLMALISDITERKKEEERLERMVNERTVDLRAANDDLKNSNKELHEVNENLRSMEARLKSTSDEFKDLYNNVLRSFC